MGWNSEALDILRGFAESKFGKLGWDVEVTATSDGLMTNLRHPLSSGVDSEIALPEQSGHAPSEAQLNEVFADLLSEPEVDFIRQSPTSRPHAELIVAIRTVASALDWRRRDLSALAAVLRDFHVLTPEEERWLVEIAKPDNHGERS